ncbi:Septin-domain-containing protein [Cyathus striatus]|nr:Septin-domain-containing protein [Cyathus striatus]
MFSFRRKPKKAPEQPRIRTSPSLPELNSQGIPWPSDLVDVAAIRQDQPPVFAHQGATKISYQAVDHAPIPFHKPFRSPSGKSNGNGPISSLYTSNPPPSAFDKRKVGTSAGRFSQRRTRVPPTFNLMVVGSKGTGKTSLLRLLLETAEISPTASSEQRTNVDRFLKGSQKPTPSIQSASVEICESRFDRILLSAIDTPGFDFHHGRELKLDRQVNNITKYLESQYAQTMNEESKVIRQSKGDQHVHLCIYLVDPASIMTAEARQELMPLPSHTRSETTVSHPPELVPDTSSEEETDNDESPEGPLTMSPAEIKVIQRLSSRCNVLPVIARADSLTDEKLLAVKNAVRKGLLDAGIDIGVFGPLPPPLPTPRKKQSKSTSSPNGENGVNDESIDGTEGQSEEDEDDERQSRTVIKLRPSRHGGRNTSHSRSRRDLSQAAEDEGRPRSPDATDRESVANVRFSAHIIAKADLKSLLPFAVIAPEVTKRRMRVPSYDNGFPPTDSPSPSQHQSEDGHSPSTDIVPQTPASMHSSKHVPFLNGPPEDFKGVFIRRFRWGTVDVLDPNHCDFAALRTAVLSTHLKLLKIRTREVLYERYRTQKLLARRATKTISEADKQSLLKGTNFK